MKHGPIHSAAARSLLVALLCQLLTGCESVPKPLPGLAGVRVAVIAEPKVGFTPGDQAGDYSFAAAATGAFEQVDYSNLDEIVVYLDPETGVPRTVLPAVTVDVAAKQAAGKLGKAVSVGQHVIVRNVGGERGTFYSVSEGNEFDLGSIAAGGQAEFVARAGGSIEVLSEASKDSVARLYVAPSPWVALARAGTHVDFINLPPGRYQLVSWHPRLPGYQAALMLAADQVSTATIKVGVNALPKAGGK